MFRLLSNLFLILLVLLKIPLFVQLHKLQFLDVEGINNGSGKYEFDVFRKDAITNVQLKPESSHNPQVLRGVFIGFVNRAMTICSEKYITQEINFLINVFIENGYNREELEKLVRQIKVKKSTPQEEIRTTENSETKQTVTLPWIPVLSPKLKKLYRKAGYKVAFKSGKNISNILTAQNKAKLPKNSFPGVYKIPCSCGMPPYRGETKKRICTRTKEHITYIEKKEWSKSGVAQHAKKCGGNILFEETETVTTIFNRFDRKVRETLEIQRHDCHYKDGGMNPDKGLYVQTKFWIPYMKYLNKLEN